MPATSTLSLIRMGMPCSGPRTLPALRSASSAARVGYGFRIELDHRIQLRPGIVDFGDAIEIRLGQRLGRQLPDAMRSRASVALSSTTSTAGFSASAPVGDAV